MYFINNFYRSIKTIAATLGLVGSSLMIIYGVLQTGGTVYVVSGSLCLANALFNLGETGKVLADIKNQVDRLKSNLNLFSQENQELQIHVHSLGNTVEQSLVQIDRLEKLRVKLDKQLSKKQDQLLLLGSNNSDLGETLSKFQEENQQLQVLLQEAKEQLLGLENLKLEFEEDHQKMNYQLEQQKKLIEDSKTLINHLAQFGDTYNEFSTTIDTNMIKLENTQQDFAGTQQVFDQTQQNLDQTSQVLSNLVEKLKQQKFNELDTDHDGKISQNEFETNLN